MNLETERTSDPVAAVPGAEAPGRALPRPLLRLVQLALTVLVTWFVVDRVGLSLAELGRFDPSRWTLRWLPLVGSCLVLMAGYLVSSLLWGRMVRELGGRRLGPVTAIRVFMVANLGRYVPGKVLQIAGLAYLARREGVAAGTATLAAVLGQALALLGATLIGLGAFFGPDESWRAWGWIGLGVVVTLVALSSVPGPARALERLWLRLARQPVEEGGPDPVRPGFGFRWTLYYAFNWGVYATAFWLLYLGLEGWATFLTVGPAFAAAYVAGYVFFFTPAGLGIREASLMAFLSPVLAPEPAMALAVVARLWTTGVELVPALALTALPSGRRGHVDEEGR